MSSTSSFRRNPLVIDGNRLASGDRATTFAPEDPDSLLRNYLIFVRELRGARREPSIQLRADDLAVIARHLGVTERLVLDGLLDLMGATRTQRTTMRALLAAGALTLVVSGTIVTNLSDDGVSVEMSRLVDAVQSVVGGDRTVAGTATSAEPTAHAAETAGTSVRTGSQTVIAEWPTTARPEADPGVGGPSTDAVADAEALLDDLALTPTADVLHSVTAARAAAGAEPADGTADGTAAAGRRPTAGADEPSSVGVAADGSLVASVAPPVPASTGDEPVATGVLPDGTSVGVAAPPVPPRSDDEPVATGVMPDGTSVAVAAPPVPPTSPSD